MLGKEYRLRKNYQFNYVYRKGTSIGSKHLVMIFAKKRSGVSIGFSVSNKIGKAVARNRVKRRLRAAARSLFSSFPERNSYIFVARNDIINLSYKEILDLMGYLLGKMRAKKDKQ